MKAHCCPPSGSSRRNTRSFTLRQIVAMLSVCGLIILAPTLALAQKKTKAVQKSVIEIISPAKTGKQDMVATGGSVKIIYKVNDDDIDSIRFKITNTYDAASGSADYKKEGTHAFTAKLFNGRNAIQLFGFNGPEAVKNASKDLIVFCNNECAGSAPVKADDAGTGTKTDSNITIQSPSGAVTEGTVESLIFVKGGIAKLSIAVYDSEKHLVDYKDSVTVRALPDGKSGFVAPELKVVKGKNLIRVFDADPAKLAEKANEALVIVTCDTCGKFDAAAAAAESKPEQKGNLKITSAKSITYGDKKEAKIKVKYEKPEAEAATEKRVIVEVLNNKKKTKGDPQTINSGTDKELTVKLGSGENKITVYEEGNPDTQRDFAVITCEGKCGSDADVKDIAIVQPKISEGETSLNLTDKSTQDAYVTVAKGSSIRSIQYDVITEGKPVFTSPAVSVNPAEKEVTVPMTLKFLKGTNTIRVYDAEHAGSNNDASIVIKCTGDNCATDLQIATIVTNSQNTRVIVGLEQAGASSSTSTTKPFLDFFFTTPILFDQVKSRELVSTTEFDSKGNPVLENGKPRIIWIRKSNLPNGDELIATTAFDSNGRVVYEKDQPKVIWIRRSILPANGDGGLRVPRAGFWGDVRLASTPEQLTTTGILPSNLANLAGKSGTASNLVQSFDFLAGLETRLFTAKGSFLSLIPGIRQKTRFYIAGGVGAISPLDAQTEAPKFSLIPGPTSSQRALFEQRYGKPPAAATHIALVPLERDRFFRQWYAGIRLKTFYCEQDAEGDPDCHRFRNSFPAIVDFMIGQNQSATGGSFKKTGTIDPATGIGKEHQAFVFRLDGFYPLPFREANFIYFYGTAIMNIFGKQNIENFLVLDPATDTPNINTPAVYVPPSSFLRALQGNRDYYKIGVGINLTDFFNRNKPKP